MSRQPLPNRREQQLIDFDFEGRRFTVVFGQYSDGRIGEVFLDCDRPDSLSGALARDATVRNEPRHPAWCGDLDNKEGPHPQLRRTSRRSSWPSARSSRRGGRVMGKIVKLNRVFRPRLEVEHRQFTVGGLGIRVRTRR